MCKILIWRIHFLSMSKNRFLRAPWNIFQNRIIFYRTRDISILYVTTQLVHPVSLYQGLMTIYVILFWVCQPNSFRPGSTNRPTDLKVTFGVALTGPRFLECWKSNLLRKSNTYSSHGGLGIRTRVNRYLQTKCSDGRAAAWPYHWHDS